VVKLSKKRQNSTVAEEKPNKRAKKSKLKLDEDDELVESNTKDDTLDQNKVLEAKIIENKLLKNVKKLEKNTQILSEDDLVQKSSKANLSLVSINTEKMYSNYWLEVLIENSNGEQEWICIEVEEEKYDCAAYLEKRLERRVLYVFSFDNENKLKDVTKRYSTEWNILSRKLRIENFDSDKFWLEKVLMNYRPLDNELDIKENKQLTQLLYQKPFPKSVSEFKDHPLYILKRHLLKFQSIYPANAKPLGKFRNEDIYSRENLVTLHSKQTWLKYARSVKPDEEAYKVVKGRLKLVS
jgi:xeroderma pigmentosum group C-complementing protein